MGMQKLEDAVRDWAQLNSKVSRISEELELTKKRRAECGQALAEIIAPDDAKIGEVFHCWVRIARNEERLIQVTVMPFRVAWDKNLYEVSFRGNKREQEQEEEA